MATKILDDVKDFLDGLVTDLTGLHVKAAHVLNTPGDRDAVDALTQLPAGLIERAQDLSGRVEKERGATNRANVHVDGKEVAKAVTRHAAKPSARK